MEGLTSTQANRLLAKYGPNELRQRKDLLAPKLLLSQFKSPLIYVLVFAGLVTLFLREFTDTIVIFAAVILNTILGFYQEFKAQKSLAALRNLLMPKVRVIRDGEPKIIDARSLIPGDLVLLGSGDRVPADGVLIEATDLTVNEAILTGESMPVRKSQNKKQPDRENLVFMGTTVVTGVGRMVVSKIGMETKMGQIGKAVEELKEEKTPLQIQLGKLAKTLAIVVGMMTILIFIIGKLRGYELLEMFTTSVAVAVAAIPEGLAVTLTVVLALGMQRILRRKAIVRRLLAAETLGSVSVICADKTGTLTEGKMRVVKADTSREDLLIRAAVLCNDLRDPLEEAIFRWVKEKLTIEEIKKLKKDYRRLDARPFSPETKFIATLHPGMIFVFGAPEVVIENCKLEIANKNLWLKKFEKYGKRGYRLMGSAYKTTNNKQLTLSSREIKDLQWLGVFVFEDSIRKGVKEALKECREAGIKVKVITGDYLPTALAVLRKLGLDGRDQSLTGQELREMSESQLKEKIDEVVLFARTDPQQKLKIVKALKEKGEVVAMMGDGVNDAPSLRQADIGIVVEEAADVAKETAEMVLLDSNFTTIVHAIEEGRNIFENLKKVTLYLLSCSFTEIILIGGCLLFRLPLPISASQILWINLIQDSLPAIALAFEPKEEGLMKDGPRKKEAAIIDLPMKILISIIVITANFFLLGLVIATWRELLPFKLSQTMVFVSLGIISSLIIFACRSLRKPIFKYNPFANKFLTASVFLGFIFLGLAVYFPPFRTLLKTSPLGVREWVFLFGLGMINVLAIELAKLVSFSRKREWLK